jgi:uncharacterized protein (DUF983 family)
MARIATRTLIGRALRKRCVICGRGAMLRSHFRMNRTCPACGVIFWKDPGESLGAMYLDYAAAVAVFIPSWIALAWLTDLTELAQLVILGMVSAAAAVLFYPYSRCLWTVLVYISGGIEPPRMRVISGGRKAS